MTTTRKIAFGCYLGALLLITLIAVIYLFTPRLLSYQETAIGADWEGLSLGMQTQLLSLMRVSGGGYLATAAALAVILFIPFRQGQPWARWAIPAIGIPAIAIVNYAGLTIIQNTPARPPLIAGPVVILLLLAGWFLAGMRSQRATRPSS